MKQIKFAKRFFLLATRLVTSCALAELAVGIAVSPSRADSLALSQSSLEFNNFSRSPLAIETLTNADTLAIARSGSSTTALAQAQASFGVNPPPAFNSSLSRAVGEGSSYLGLAQSEDQIIGDFFIEAGQTFSFDFAANLDLNTSINNPSFESATATGNISLSLIDSTFPATIYDSFLLSGNLITPGNNDFLNFQGSDNITVNQNETSFNTDFVGTQELARASVTGSLERRFDRSTSITLIEAKANRVSVQAPEPSNKLALLFFLGLIGALKLKSTRSTCS